MTADNDSVREQFEEAFPVPFGVYWRISSEKYSGVKMTHDALADEHNRRLETWQASRERYVPSPCEWLQDEWDSSWHTSCGNTFEIIDGTPEDNEMKHCTYCGGHLIATPNGGNES